MPILASPNTKGGLGQSVPVPSWPNEQVQVSWTDAQGNTTLLSDWNNGISFQPGARGFGMPTYLTTTQASPGLDGYQILSTQAVSREIMLPIALYADTRADFQTRYRALLRSFNPKLGPGTLTVTEADGSSRSINCYYTSGGEGSEDRDTSGLRWKMASFVFNCPLPYWLGPQVELVFSVPDSANFFPILPLVVQADNALGSTTITNDADDIAWPVWTITGPGTAINLTNNTTGESVSITQIFSLGDSIVIDTRERAQTAYLNGTTNLWPLLGSSVLWGLQPGDNDIDITVTGASSTTTITMDYQLRYMSI